jgi:hypothetical protein
MVNLLSRICSKADSFVVRMRAKEVIELLGNSEKIRVERQKAKENKNKYTGVSSAAASSGIAGRFGGFGNPSFGSKHSFILLNAFFTYS